MFPNKIIVFTLILLCMVCVLSAPLFLAADQDKSGATATPTPNPNAGGKFDEKSPALAGFLGFVPGLVIHGLGHFYAGRNIEGTCLMLMEGGALYMGYQAYVLGYGAANGLSDNPTQNTTNLNGALTLGLGSVLLFTTSWMYDWLGAPMACSEWNKEQRAKVSLNLVPVDRQSMLVLSWRNKF